MKLVRDYHYQSDAKALSLKLRDKGVLTFTAPSKAIPNKPLSGLYKRHNFRTGVWVVLEEQLSDAVKLSKGNKHIVEKPLTEEEMKEIEIEVEKLKAESNNKYLTTASLVIVAGVLIIIAYSVLKNV